MKRLIAVLAAVIALGVLAIPSAGASSGSSGGSVCWDTPALHVAYENDIAQGGYIGWGVHSEVSTYHQRSHDCTTVDSYWPEVNIVAAQFVYRQVYGGGWVNCFYQATSGSGFVSLDANSVTSGMSGVCASNAWPAYYTKVVSVFTAYVSGTGYTFGPNSTTTVYA